MSDRFVIDPERIAALLDGRLSPEAREQLLVELSDSPEGLEILAQATQLMDESAETKASPSEGAMPRSWRRPALWLAAAAAVVIVGVGLTQRFGRTRELPGPEVMVAMLQPASPGDRPSTAPSDLWPQMRSAGDGAQKRAIAVRVGALLTDLEVQSAVPADSGAARLSAKIASLLETMSGGAIAARGFQANDIVANPTTRHDAIRNAELIAGTTFVRAGAWLEAARIAIARRDSTFFSNTLRSGRRTLDDVAREVPSIVPIANQLTEALSARPINWDAAAASASNLLAELGR